MSLRPEGSPIYKNTRELFDRAFDHGHFGVLIFKIRRLSFFSQIGTRFSPLLIRKLKKSVSRSISGLEKRYTHVNRSEFHQKTIGIETISVGGPVSGIVRVLRFSPEDLRLTLGSDAFTARTLEYIQKHKRAF